MRFLAAVLAGFVLIAPLQRAFAWPAPAAPLAAVRADRASRAVQIAHRAPRRRRQERTLVALPPSSAPLLPAPARSRRGAASARRSARAGPFADLPDHPPS